MNHYVTGSTIKALREKQRLTQSQLAEKLCVSDKTISVSYTHLDVYKRQIQPSFLMKMSLPSLRSAVRKRKTTAPASIVPPAIGA